MCRECRNAIWMLNYRDRMEDPDYKQKRRDNCLKSGRRLRRKKKLLKKIANWRQRMNPMKTMFEDLRDFHEKFGLAYDGPPRELPHELAVFRTKFVAEELAEYVTPFKGAQQNIIAEVEKLMRYTLGMEQQPLEKKLDALVDLVYIAIGSAYLHGFDFDEAWRRVHKANMAKVRSAAKGNGTERGGQFDVIKPPGWTPPDLSDLVQPASATKPYDLLGDY